MLSIVISKKLLDKIKSGKVTYIHKPINDYYTQRFTTKFGVIGDENITEDIQVITSHKNYDLENRLILTCTICIGTGKQFKDSNLRLLESKERYVLTILKVKKVESTESNKTSDLSKVPISATKAAQILKKKKLCMKRKANGCEQKCIECPYNVIESDLISAYDKAVTSLGRNGEHTYNKGSDNGYKRGVEYMLSYQGLTAPREVINTKGFNPYCQVCRSTTSIYSKDGSMNQFCGKCGALLDWKSVLQNEDNYEKIKNNSALGYNLVNYRLRRMAIDEYINENRAAAVARQNYEAPPVEALKDDTPPKRGRKKKMTGESNGKN